MLLPKGGVNWKAAQSRLPASRTVGGVLFRSRTWLTVGLVVAIFLLWRSLRSSTEDMQRFYCFGPSKSPLQMSANEYSDWHGMQSPIIFNQHEPIEVNTESIHHVDLNQIRSTRKALANHERVLILTPMRDASPYLNMYFELLAKLTYPHDLIDLAFLVGDSQDTTMTDLVAELERLQKRRDMVPFNSVTIIEKDFGVHLSQNVEDRHGFAAQGPRRKAIGRARNYLLYSALKPEHSWVYWRDVDIQESPADIIQDMIAHDTDVIVPNIWFHRLDANGKDVEGRFDYNSWVESDKGLKLAASLDKNVVLAEGYKEFDTGRKYMATMGDWRLNKDEELELDGIGGVNIIVKADVHRSGINFPCYAFENQAETEGFAKMSRRAGYRVIGLPNYVVWHIDTDEKPGNLGAEFAWKANVQT